jgi:hypothetical protein
MGQLLKQAGNSHDSTLSLKIEQSEWHAVPRTDNADILPFQQRRKPGVRDDRDFLNFWKGDFSTLFRVTTSERSPVGHAAGTNSPSAMT